jgi:type IV pilus assembly protein PilW
MGTIDMNMHTHKRPTDAVCKRRSRQDGLSLIELMVAMVISLFLLAGVIQIFIGSKQSYRVNEGLSRLQENARYAFDRIAQDLNASGYMGCNDSRGVDVNGDLLLTNALSDTTTAAYDFTSPLDGAEGTGPNGSDTINIRRAVTSSAVPLAAPMDSTTSTILLDDTHPNYQGLEQWQLMAISDCNSSSIFMITNDPAASAGVIEHAPGDVSPVGSSNEGQSNATTTITSVGYNDLKARYGSLEASEATSFRVATTSYNIRTSDSGTGLSLALNGDELVEGVQDLQVLYGLDTDGTPGVERYVPAGPVLTAAGMNQVAAVKLTLVLNMPSGVQVDGQAVTKVVTQTFRLRNR